MFKKLILAIILALSVSVSVSVMAMDLKLNEEWSTQAVSGVVFKADDAQAQFSGGVFFGPIANLRTNLGKSVLGLGGLIGNVKVDETGVYKGAVGITAITLFDNIIQGSVVIDPTEYKWIDPDSYMFAVTIQPVGALEVLGGSVTTLFGMIAK